MTLQTATADSTGELISINSIAYIDGKYIATSCGGIIRFSSDYITWESVDTGLGDVSCLAITMRNGKYVMIGAYSSTGEACLLQRTE